MNLYSLFFFILCLYGVVTVLTAAPQNKTVKPPPPKNVRSFARKTEQTKEGVPWEQSGYHEGDIVLSQTDLTRNGVKDEELRWTDGVIPYYIDDTFDDTERETILDVMETEYHNKTCIRWRPFQEGDANWVEFRSSKPGCSSNVGMLSGGQIINLQRNWCVWHDTATHEMMHAIGFYHQQSATERDDYIDLFLDNVKDGLEYNFVKYDSKTVTEFGVGYDYQSIMHYSKNAFTKNGKPTMLPKEGDFELGNREGLTEKDVKKIAAMYKNVCKNTENM